MNPEEFEGLVEQVLNHRTFQQGIQNILRVGSINSSPISTNSLQQTSTVRNLAGTSPSTTVQEEFRRLFRPASNSIPSTSSGRRGTPVRAVANRKFKNAFSNFSKQVIVLHSPVINRTLSQKEMASLYINNSIRMLTFSKSWTEIGIKNHIKESFDHLLINTEFELLYPCGRQLVPVPLQVGETMNGLNLHKIYQNKKIYVRPLQDINIHSDIVSEQFSDNNDIGNVDDTIVHDIENQSEILMEPVNQNDEKLENSITIYDEDDEDLQEAIRNSLLEDSFSNSNSDTSFNEELKNIQNNILDDRTTLINIVRDDVVNCIERAFSRKSFSPFNKVDALFVDEDAIDSGGPSREMWRLALNELHNSNIFKGAEYSKNVNFILKDYQENKYYLAGQIIAMSLIHGGPGPGFFSKLFVDCLINGFKGKKNLCLEDIGCAQTYSELKKVAESDTLEDLIKSVSESEYLQTIGVSVFIKDIHQKETILEGALEHYLLHLKREATEQLVEGLKVGNIYELLKKYPMESEKLLCKHIEKLTVNKINELFQINYSEEGTEKKRKEKIIIAYWRDYIQLCADGECQVELSELLSFTTGASEIPPLGFPISPSIAFLHHEEHTKYPKANTCSLTLYLPVISINSFETFKNNMDFGIINAGCTFGFA